MLVIMMTMITATPIPTEVDNELDEASTEHKPNIIEKVVLLVMAD
jgi:hypothetical protein